MKPRPTCRNSSSAPPPARKSSSKAGKPKAKLVPYEAPRKKRIGGQNLLGITYMAEDWDGPLPPEIQKYFDGEADDEDIEYTYYT
jgi:hypothetical protein